MTANPSILQSFLEAGKDTFISGEELARRHGISRVAIHARIKKLEQSGIMFEAVPRRGYRLASEPPTLNADLLQAHLKQSGTDLSLHFLEEVDSTNLEVERHLASGDSDPLAVIALRQTHGRGRMGRTWHSTHPGNLYLSIGFRPEAPNAAIGLFSLWAGIRVAESIREATALPVKVKWPNDLHVEGQKIGGILCEAKMELDRVQTLLFGLGLNMNQDAHGLPDNLRTPANTLKSLLGKSVPIHPLTISILQAVTEGYDACQQSGSGKILQKTFLALDALRDKTVTVLNGASENHGVARGIDTQGNLLLEAADGSLSAIRAGDVSLKK